MSLGATQQRIWFALAVSKKPSELPSRLRSLQPKWQYNLIGKVCQGPAQGFRAQGRLWGLATIGSAVVKGRHGRTQFSKTNLQCFRSLRPEDDELKVPPLQHFLINRNSENLNHLTLYHVYMSRRNSLSLDAFPCLVQLDSQGCFPMDPILGSFHEPHLTHLLLRKTSAGMKRLLTGDVYGTFPDLEKHCDRHVRALG